MLREWLILEVQLERFSKVLQRLFDGLALAGDLDLEAAGNVPWLLVGDGGGESHGRESMAPGQVREADRCSRPQTGRGGLRIRRLEIPEFGEGCSRLLPEVGPVCALAEQANGKVLVLVGWWDNDVSSVYMAKGGTRATGLP